MPDNSEKTEEPTPKRKRELREKGQVAKSTEISSVLVLIVGLMVLRIAGPWFFRNVSEMMVVIFEHLNKIEVNQNNVVTYTKTGLFYMFKVTAPVIFSILVIAVTANILHIGPLLALKAIEPKFSKINPVKGFTNLFSMKSMFNLLKNILKLVIVAAIAYVILKNEIEEILILGDAGVGGIFKVMVSIGFKIGMYIAIALLILAVFDLLYQRYSHDQQQKMTVQEVKEERKQSEGDPQLKARIRQLQTEMAKRRMMQEVPEATVVVTNPTFIAIAIKYEMETMETPVIVAKGKRAVAEKIRETAKEHDIPIVEDKPLARGLYDVVEPGDEIPQEFFASVAEILAYIYKLNNRAA